MKLRSIAAFAIGPIGAAVISLITLPILTWFYSVQDIGRISMLKVAISFAVLILSLGFDQAFVRDYHESADKSHLFKTAIFPGLLVCLTILLFSLITPGYLSRALFGIDSRQISILASLCFLAGFMANFLSYLLRMQERGFAYSMSQILPKALFLAVVFVYFLIKSAFDFKSLVFAQAITLIAVAVMFGWNTRAVWIKGLSKTVDMDELRRMFLFGAPLIFGSAAYWGLVSTDRLLLRSLSTFRELGLYSVATSFSSAAVLLQAVFSTVWVPTVYKWVAEGVSSSRINKITDYVTAAAVGLFAFGGLFSWVVRYFLPIAYTMVPYILVSCMAYPLFYTISETTVVGISIARKTGYSMVASLIAAFINFILNYLLIPSYGAAGAAVSTAVAFWTFLFLRTEFSVLVWRSMPRLKLYLITLSCLVVASLFTLIGKKYTAQFIVVWIGLLTISVYLYRNILKETVAIFSEKLRLYFRVAQ